MPLEPWKRRLGATVAMISAIIPAVVEQAPVRAHAAPSVKIRIVVDGRLLGQPATLRIHDGAGEQTVMVATARGVRVQAGRISIIPEAITGGSLSTAYVQRFTAAGGEVVRIHYRKDTTSRPGPLVPLATAAGGAPARSREWAAAPDGTRVAFASKDPAMVSPGESSAVFVRDLTSGRVTEAVGEAGGSLSWSPDSRRVAVLSDTALLPGDNNTDTDVYVKDLVNGDLLLASAHTDGSSFHRARQGAWQDDDHVVFDGCDTAEQCRHGWPGIYARTLSNGRTRQVLSARYGAEAWELAPDGRRLVFESRRDPLDLGVDRRALYVTDVATARTTLLSRNPRGRPANGPAWGAVWSPDSSRVAYRSTGDNLVARDTNGDEDARHGTDVFITDLGSASVIRVSTTSSGKQMAGDKPRPGPAVRWSPNGKVVAFTFTSGTGVRLPAADAVFIKRLTSGRLERLIPRRFSSAVGDVAFSPSGERIAFRFPLRGCRTDLVPFANLNCQNVLVRDLRSHRLANVSTLDSGLGWLGGATDGRRGTWSPVWLTDDQLLFLAPGRSGSAVPVIKTVEWAPEPAALPVPRVPPWCDPNRYWWSC